MARRAMAMGVSAVDSIWAVEFLGKKNIMKFVMGLFGRQSATAHNNQPNKRGRDGEWIGEGA